MFKKILCAFDGSDPATHAFDVAVEVAARFASELIVLAVAELPEPPELVETAAMLDRAREYYQEQFENLEKRAVAPDLRLRCDVAVGHPAEQILQRAEAEGVDLIVMGHRGRSFIAAWLLGSVSKRVLSYATCAVMVVR